LLTHVEANFDDAIPELLAHTINLLLMVSPAPPAVAVMTKNNAITNNQLLEIVLRHTPTLGICIQCDILRAALVRNFMKVQLPYRDDSMEKVDKNWRGDICEGKIQSVQSCFCEDCSC
jgi:uncharacterized protein (DUF111 family)